MIAAAPVMENDALVAIREIIAPLLAGDMSGRANSCKET